MAKINYTQRIGSKFGRLEILSLEVKDKPGNKKVQTYANCKCDCGKQKLILMSSVVRGDTQSCGCLNLENTRQKGLNNTKHGHSRRRGSDGSEGHHNRSKAYKLWCSIKRRCLTPSASGYYKYGARGVTICDRWKDSFENFLSDMGEPQPGMSIDRIDNSKGYEPSNCRWATTKEQARNKTTNWYIEIDGVKKALIDWVEEYYPHYGIPYSCVQARLNNGRDIISALTDERFKRVKKTQR